MFHSGPEVVIQPLRRVNLLRDVVNQLREVVSVLRGVVNQLVAVVNLLGGVVNPLERTMNLIRAGANPLPGTVKGLVLSAAVSAKSFQMKAGGRILRRVTDPS